MTTRVYQYGLLAPTSSAELVREQMRAGHRYYNDLIAIERGQRAAVRLLIEGHAGLKWLIWAAEHWEKEVEVAGRRIKAARAETRSRSETTAMREVFAVAKRELRAARQTLAFGRALVRSSSDMTAIYDRAAELKKSARKYCGAYWGTYLLAEAASEEAAKDTPLYEGTEPNDPKFRRWDGSGHVSVQLQGGMDVAEALSGEDTRLQLIDVTTGTPRRGRRFYTLRMRVSSDEHKAPVWAEWPMVMHRPMPEGARIKVATATCRRDGYRDRWTVEITVSMADPKPRFGKAIGVDIGWRAIGDGVRVAYWYDQDGKEGEVKIDATMLSSLTKAASLRAIRDRSFNETRGDFDRPASETKPARGAHGLVGWLQGRELPEWLRAATVRRGKDLPTSAQATAYIAQWRSQSKLAGLVRRWKDNRMSGDEAIFEALVAWAKQDYHLWQWETEQRHQSLERRKHFYRNFAARIASEYATVVVEDFNLSRMAKRPSIDADPHNEAANATRHLVAPSKLRDALENAVRARGGQWVEVPAEYTTIKHHESGAAAIGDPSKSVTLAYADGHVEDQDRNAAISILGRASGRRAVQPPGPARSPEDSEKKGEQREGRWAKAKREKREKKEREAARNLPAEPAE